MTNRTCPLGDDCDLTVAWMAGQADARDTITALRAEVARLRAERDAALAGAVKVKPLVWHIPEGQADRAMLYAYGAHGYGYEIYSDGAWFKLHGPERRICGALKSEDTAKAAAQADYEARILAALEPDTDRLARDLAVARAALDEAARMIDCGCDHRAQVLAAPPNSGQRWRLCQQANCGALDAADIRAIDPAQIAEGMKE